MFYDLIVMVLTGYICQCIELYTFKGVDITDFKAKQAKLVIVLGLCFQILVFRLFM